MKIQAARALKAGASVSSSLGCVEFVDPFFFYSIAYLVIWFRFARLSLVGLGGEDQQCHHTMDTAISPNPLAAPAPPPMSARELMAKVQSARQGDH
jgi:hypothetical protein